MKKYILMILFFTLSINLFALTNDGKNAQVNEYDKIFKQMGEKRIGISNQKIDSIDNPFIMANKKVSMNDGNVTTIGQEVTYTLNSIFNDKAKINGKWYKLNSEIGNFKLTKIMNKSVIIQNEHSKKELFIRKSNVSKIKFSSK